MSHKIGSTDYTDKYLFLKYLNTDKRLGYVDDNPMTEFNEQVKINDLNKMTKENDEYYFFGPYDMIFMKDDTNLKIAEQMSFLLMDKIDKGENITTILLGKSGAGKTSTGIYFYKKEEGKKEIRKDGVIIELMKRQLFVDKFRAKGLKLKMRNIYVTHGIKRISMKDVKSDSDYKINILGYDGVDEPKFFYDDTKKNWFYHKYDEQTGIYTKQDMTLASIINYGLETREVEPTVNNPDSSRSALLIQVLCTDENGKEQSIFMWDLPGSERFKCDEGLSWILKLDDSYTESLKYGDRKENKVEIKFDDVACKQSEEINQQNIDDEIIYKDFNKNLKDMFDDNDKFDKIHQFEDDINEEDLLKYIRIDTYKGQKKVSVDGLKSKCEKVNQEIKECSKRLKYKKDEDFMKDVTSVKDYFEKLEKKKEESQKTFIIWRNIRNVLFFISKMVEKIEKKGGGVKDQETLKKFQKDKKFKHLFDGIFKEMGNKTFNATDELLPVEMITDDMKKKMKKIIKEEANKEVIKGTDFLSLDENNLNYLTMVFAYQFLLKEFKLEKESITIGKNNMVQFNNFKKFTKLFVENKKKIRTKYKEYKEEYKSILCEIYRLRKLCYNCKLRVTEGYMINQTLTQLKSDMKKIILKSVASKNNGILPVALDRDVYTYCRNAYLESEYFDDLYTEIKNESFTGQIVKIMESKEHFNTPLDKDMNFCIFTVINVTDNNVLDNRPNPPYINISNLIYNLDIKNGGMRDKTDYVLLRKYFFEIMSRLEKYKFYIDMIADTSKSFVGETILSDLHQKYLSMKKNTDKPTTFSQEEIVFLVKTLIDIISVNNEATLVGSLQSTEEIANIVFNKVVCSYNKDLDDVFSSFVKMPLDKFEYMKSQSRAPSNPKEIIDILSVSK
jgi:hypothetical protein